MRPMTGSKNSARDSTLRRSYDRRDVPSGSRLFETVLNAKKKATIIKVNTNPLAVAGIEADMKGHMAAASPCPAPQSTIVPTRDEARHTAELASRANERRRNIPVVLCVVIALQYYSQRRNSVKIVEKGGAPVYGSAL